MVDMRGLRLDLSEVYAGRRVRFVCSRISSSSISKERMIDGRHTEMEQLDATGLCRTLYTAQRGVYFVLLWSIASGCQEETKLGRFSVTYSIEVVTQQHPPQFRTLNPTHSFVVAYRQYLVPTTTKLPTHESIDPMRED